jgi:hypothetical protein
VASLDSLGRGNPLLLDFGGIALLRVGSSGELGLSKIWPLRRPFNYRITLDISGKSF